MNVQLVDSLIEAILNLPSEDQQLFQSKFFAKQMINPDLVHRREALTENVEHFRKWVSQFPKSKANLPNESLHRETIYGDRGR
jgi:hypothetical protein